MLPVSNSSIYLILGLLLSPLILDLAAISFTENRKTIEMATKLAITLSLFIDGLKMDAPMTWKRWRGPTLLGGPVMVLTIFLLTLVGHYLFSLTWGASILLGAILAPTDPVLASVISLKHANDDHETRFSLSGEAGFNDGTAFPFIFLGLELIEDSSLSWVGPWFVHRILWAVPAGLAVGFVVGLYVSRWGIKLRSRFEQESAPNDFLALGLVAICYALAEFIGAWGFLAAFSCGIGMRAAANQLSETTEREELPEEIAERENGQSQKSGNVAGTIISDIFRFGETAERILEFGLIFLVGLALSSYWDPRSIWLALLLFLVIRPLTVMLFLRTTGTDKSHSLLISWFGVKGIGSLYYLCYVLGHTSMEEGSILTGLVLSTVCLSIVTHTVSVRPVFQWVEGKKQRSLRPAARSADC